MSELDDKAASLPVSSKVSSKPTIPSEVDVAMNKALNMKTMAPERSVNNGPRSNVVKDAEAANAAKRKQSKIKLDSDEDESDEEPLAR